MSKNNPKRSKIKNRLDNQLMYYSRKPKITSWD